MSISNLRGYAADSNPYPSYSPGSIPCITALLPRLQTNKRFINTPLSIEHTGGQKFNATMREVSQLSTRKRSQRYDPIGGKKDNTHATNQGLSRMGVRGPPAGVHYVPQTDIGQHPEREIRPQVYNGYQPPVAVTYHVAPVSAPTIPKARYFQSCMDLPHLLVQSVPPTFLDSGRVWSFALYRVAHLIHIPNSYPPRFVPIRPPCWLRNHNSKCPPSGMSFRYTVVRALFDSFTFVSNFPPPPDLTRYISKADDQYVAGGGFGDVYRCWYDDGSLKEVRM